MIILPSKQVIQALQIAQQWNKDFQWFFDTIQDYLTLAIQAEDSIEKAKAAVTVHAVGVLGVSAVPLAGRRLEDRLSGGHLRCLPSLT